MNERARGPLRSGSVWPVASLAALLLCCSVDLLVPPRAVNLAFPLYLLALALWVGALQGALWAGAFRMLQWLPGWLAGGVWVGAGAAGALWLAYRLGAFTRLNSRYSHLAVGVLVGAGLAGLAFGGLCAALQPTASRGVGWLRSRSMLARRIAAALLVCSFAGLQLADRRLYPNQYPLAHTALRLAALWCAMFAIVLAVRALPRLSALGFGITFAGYVACLVLLDDRRVLTLNAFAAHPWATGVLTVSRSLVDFDRDGHAAFLGDTDCAPWDPRVHPGARDIPDNGIDENCVLGDATARAARIENVPIATEAPALDVVLITVDAFNPQHIGLYNPERYGASGRATTPNLDRWAEQATVFEHAYSPGGWTSVAVPSLLRGVYARRLHWRKYFETSLNAMVDRKGLSRLRPGEHAMHMFPFAFGDAHPTLAEMLKRRGLATFAITDDGYSGMLERGSGIERGFDSYQEVDSLPVGKRDDSGTAELALTTLNSLPEDRRFFLWVHFFGTHYPDEHHDGIRDYGNSVADAYDHEVAFLDTQLIRVLDAIAQRKHAVAVFVSADHSEGLSPVSRYHGDSLDEPVIRIPLLARVPGWPAGRIPQVVSSIDLVPTLLALVKSPLPRHLDGIDLATVLDGRLQPRVLFSDTWRYDPFEHVVGDFAAAYDGTRKYVLDRRSGDLFVATQLDPRPTERLIGRTPTDGLSAAVYAYLEESGTMQLSD